MCNAGAQKSPYVPNSLSFPHTLNLFICVGSGVVTGNES